MQLTDRLDLFQEITRTHKNRVKQGLVMLFLVPIGLCGFIAWARGNDPSALLAAKITAGLFSLFGAATLAYALHAKRHPEQEDAFRWTQFGTAEQQWTAIEEDWNGVSAMQKFCSDTWYITPNWLLHRGDTTFATCPLRCIACMYLTCTRRKMGTDHTLTVCCTDGHKITGSILTEGNANELMLALRERAPWAMYGYSEGLKESWDQNRDEFLTAARLRLSQIEAGQAQPQLWGAFLPETRKR